jgi:hypothetical protein
LLQKFIGAFSKFMNPFDESINQSLLFNISSGKAASENVEIFFVQTMTNELREKFISDCSESVDRCEKPITRVGASRVLAVRGKSRSPEYLQSQTI